MSNKKTYHRVVYWLTKCSVRFSSQSVPTKETPTTTTCVEVHPTLYPSTNPTTAGYKSNDSSHNAAKECTTGSPTNTQRQPTMVKSTANTARDDFKSESNGSSHNRSLRASCEDSGTTLLIAIPLAGFVVVLVVVIVIVYHCRWVKTRYVYSVLKHDDNCFFRDLKIHFLFQDWGEPCPILQDHGK